VQLFTCNGGANQQWLIDGSAGQLFNPVSGRCLTDPGGTKKGVQLWISNCTGNADQAWILPASPVQSGIAGMCMNDPGNSTVDGTQIQMSTCSGAASERWTMEPDGTLRINGKCLDVAQASKLDGAKIDLFTCKTGSSNANQRWAIGSDGELFSLGSGRCVADPGDSTTNGTGLVQEDCYGRAGEIWAVT
jgi:Ricin-type beta-trefoil lectin domain